MLLVREDSIQLIHHTKHHMIICDLFYNVPEPLKDPLTSSPEAKGSQ